jgi:hypothetical protein
LAPAQPRQKSLNSLWILSKTKGLEEWLKWQNTYLASTGLWVQTSVILKIKINK